MSIAPSSAPAFQKRRHLKPSERRYLDYVKGGQSKARRAILNVDFLRRRCSPITRRFSRRTDLPPHSRTNLALH
jgi:hypothetical protein